MIRCLVWLLDLLTNYQALEVVVRNVFSFGLANTAIGCLIGGVEIGRRTKLRRNTAAPSGAQ
jgi:hypothetical protein